MNRRRAKNRDALPPPTPSEAAFEKLLASFDGRATTPSAVVSSSSEATHEPSEADDFVERLFREQNKYLEDDRFRTIGDAASFYTKIVGVSFEGRQDIVAGLRERSELVLERQPKNQFDSNAIAVRYGALQLGFLRKEIAKHLAPKIDGGTRYRCSVGSLTGGASKRTPGGEEKNLGVNIFVERESKVAVAPGVHARAAADEEALQRALIGDAALHPGQEQVLARVRGGKNTLVVMGTGRGKSYCFQFPAALGALASSQKTLIIYPLRALANDQYEALVRRFDGFGLRIFRANGSISAEERAELFDALAQGAWDMVLATPEFLQFHHDAFGAQSRPALAVVDEAHHLFESRHRPAYQRLGAMIRSLGDPQVIAATATANDETFAHILKTLSIDAWVIDPWVRENLTVVDARETNDKDAYLARALDGGGKAIVYTNSKSGCVKVAERLRAMCGNAVSYYHAGLGTPERLEVERLFRESKLRVIVATSAFGEGIDLSDVRDVVLYHLNFDFTEFNQQAGRAGRDGLPARIHLLFGQRDRTINDFIIDRQAPRIPILREVYRGMRKLTQTGEVRSTFVDIARTLELDKTDEKTISAAVRIFEDAGLLHTGIDDDGRFLRFLPANGKIDLSKNERFAEGEAERDAFERFCALVLKAGAGSLQQIINRPIYPQHAVLQR